MLLTRYNGWFAGGLCECCQAIELEADPPVYLECFDGIPAEIVQRSSFPPHLKYNVKYPPSADLENPGDFPKGFMLRRCQGAMAAPGVAHLRGIVQ
jgi:hypothetical protein